MLKEWLHYEEKLMLINHNTFGAGRVAEKV